MHGLIALFLEVITLAIILLLIELVALVVLVVATRLIMALIILMMTVRSSIRQIAKHFSWICHVEPSNLASPDVVHVLGHDN